MHPLVLIRRFFSSDGSLQPLRFSVGRRGIRRDDNVLDPELGGRARKADPAAGRHDVGQADRNDITDGGEYLTYWLAEHARHRVRATTYRSYEQLVRLYLIPLFGNKKLARLRPGDIRRGLLKLKQ